MHILVIDGNSSRLASLVSTLKTLDHRVTAAASDREVLEVAGVADLAIVPLERGHADAMRTIRDLRAVVRKGYLFVMVAGLASDDEKTNLAYESGADGDLRITASAAALKGRLRAVHRLLGLRGHSEPEPAIKADGAPGSASPTLHELATTSKAWKALPHEIKTNAGVFLTMPVSLGNAELMRGPHFLMRGITLTNPESQLEIRVGLATDEASARALAVHCFGEDSEDLQGDMLGELANIAMGAIKSSFGREHISFTGGLPDVVAGNGPLTYCEACVYQEAFSLTAQEARVLIRIGLRSRKNEMLSVAQLTEGMVLAKDLYNARGMLLLTGGTRLSETTTERLRKALPESAVVEVSGGH